MPLLKNSFMQSLKLLDDNVRPYLKCFIAQSIRFWMKTGKLFVPVTERFGAGLKHSKSAATAKNVNLAHNHPNKARMKTRLSHLNIAFYLTMSKCRESFICAKGAPASYYIAAYAPDAERGGCGTTAFLYESRHFVRLCGQPVLSLAWKLEWIQVFLKCAIEKNKINKIYFYYLID